MKRLIKSLLLFLLLFFSGFWTQEVFAANQRIYDQADLYTVEEIEKIEEAILAFEKSSGMAAVVVTNNQDTTKSTRDYADDFYDEHGFGTGAEKSGVLFLIDVNQRGYWLSTTGKAIKLFTDERINSLLNYAESPMREENYGEATLRLLNQATNYSETYHYNKLTGKFQPPYKLSMGMVLLAAALALFGGGIVYLIICSTYRIDGQTYQEAIEELKKVDMGHIFFILGMYETYMEPAPYEFRKVSYFNLNNSQDEFISKEATSRYVPPPPKEKSSGGGSSGGGSSTHTSSSGTTHGGGGRSF